MNSKRVNLINILTLFVLIVCVLRCVLLNTEATSLVKEDSYYTYPIKHNEKYKFSLNDVEKVIKDNKDISISYEYITFSDIKALNEIKDIKCITTNYEYNNLYGLDFLYGNFFDEYTEKINSKVIVIDEQLALKLFGTTNVLDENVLVESREYKIVGVVKKSERKAPVCYIPMESTENKNVDSLIFNVKCDNKVEAQIKLKNALTNMSNDTTNIKIVSMSKYLFFINLKNDVISFIIGSMITIFFCQMIYIILKNIYYRIHNDRKKYYLIQNVYKNMFYIIRKSLLILIFLILIYFIISVVKINISEFIASDNFIIDNLILFFNFKLIDVGICNHTNITFLNNVNANINIMFLLEMISIIILIYNNKKTYLM